MTEQKKIRHSEYYNLQEVFDKLYAHSKQGEVFTRAYLKTKSCTKGTLMI